MVEDAILHGEGAILVFEGLELLDFLLLAGGFKGLLFLLELASHLLVELFEVALDEVKFGALDADVVVLLAHVAGDVQVFVVVVLVDTVLDHVKQVHRFRILLTSPRKGVVVED